MKNRSLGRVRDNQYEPAPPATGLTAPDHHGLAADADHLELTDNDTGKVAKLTRKTADTKPDDGKKPSGAIVVPGVDEAASKASADDKTKHADMDLMLAIESGGDIVEVTVSGIGTLRNTVHVAEVRPAGRSGAAARYCSA